MFGLYSSLRQTFCYISNTWRGNQMLYKPEGPGTGNQSVIAIARLRSLLHIDIAVHLYVITWKGGLNLQPTPNL